MVYALGRKWSKKAEIVKDGSLNPRPPVSGYDYVQRLFTPPCADLLLVVAECALVMKYLAPAPSSHPFSLLQPQSNKWPTLILRSKFNPFRKRKTAYRKRLKLFLRRKKLNYCRRHCLNVLLPRTKQTSCRPLLFSGDIQKTLPRKWTGISRETAITIAGKSATKQTVDQSLQVLLLL